MVFKFRFLVGLAFICVSLLTVFLYKNLSKHEQSIAIIKSNLDNSRQSYKQPTFVGFELIQYSEGKKLSYIKGNKAIIKNRRVGFVNLGILKIIAIEKPEIGFYALNAATIDAKISGDYAELDLLTKDIFFQGSINISSGSKELACNAMRFTHENRGITIRNGFILKDKQENSNITGEKLKGDIYLENLFYK